MLVLHIYLCRLYRLDYDIAVGVSGHTAKEIALNEITKPTDPIPYTNSDEFTIWCKTQLSKAEWTLASGVAAARMIGRPWTVVHAADELKRGDHFAYNCGKIYYYQHAIVSGVDVEGILLNFLAEFVRNPRNDI